MELRIWRSKLCEISSQRLRVQDLREQVRDLMVYLEAVQMAGDNGEMAGGTASVGAAKPKRRQARR